MHGALTASFFKVQAWARRWALDWIIWAAIGLAAALLASILVYGLQIGHWRHDSFLYISEDVAALKARQEGRWLNFLLFDALQFVPGHLAWLLNLICVGAASFFIARGFGLSIQHGLALSLCWLLFPGLQEQNTWPVTTLPASVLFLAGVVTLPRIGWYWAPVFGVLLFATIPSFYFILPLVILSDYRNDDWRGFFVMAGKGLVWGLGLIAGYGVSAWFNWQEFGSFGFEIAEWREPHPAHDLPALWRNVLRYAHFFPTHVFQWLPSFGAWALLAAYFMAAPGFFKDKRFAPAALVKASYAGVVMLAPYLVLLGVGIVLQHRSLLPMAVGLLALPVLLAPINLRGAVIALMLIGVGLPSGWDSLQGTRWFSEFTRVNIRNVAHALDRYPRAFPLVVVDAPDIAGYVAGVQRQIPIGLNHLYFQEFLTEPDRVIAAFAELGASSTIPCQLWEHEKCALIREKIANRNACQDNIGQVCVIGVEDAHLLVALRP